MYQAFSSKPFHLDQAAIDWVGKTHGALSPRQKIAQLFNVLIGTNDREEIDEIKALAPGSIARAVTFDPAKEQTLLAEFNAANPVPILVTADLEGSFSAPRGSTPVPNQLGMAAVDDVAATSEISRIMAHEAAEYGIKWSFTPVLDINAAFRSAIVGTRSYGSDPARIQRHALAHIAALQAEGTAATAKHWPGEGFDERDQHLVTTINPLSMPEWEARFGMLYRAAIDAGVMTVMIGHIALPAYMREVLGPDETPEHYKPATINRYLNEGLLRGRLGFKGLIVSDATGMAGLGSWMTRAEFVPEVIAAGCDVVLFTPTLAEDIATVEKALDDGRLTWARIDEAVARQLALKAALGLHKNPPVPRGERDRGKDKAFADEVISRVPTLVRDREGMLPLSPAKTRRIYMVSEGIVRPMEPEPRPLVLADMLRAEGFEVTEHRWGTPVSPEGHDLLLFAFAEESLLTRGTITLDWLGMNGHFIPALRRHWHDLPSLMISFGHPYYLYEATHVPAYINAYAAIPEMQKAMVDTIMGRTPFRGSSPVDPFCGLPDFL